MKLFLVYLIAVASAAILGIDLGQQYTKAVLLAPGVNFELVLTDEGKRKDLLGLSIRQHPSIAGELERSYGSATGSLCTRFPQSCVLHVKPLLGKSIDDHATLEYVKLHFVRVFGDESRDNAIRFDVGIDSDTFSVEEIVAMSLSNIKQRALADIEEQSVTGKPIVDVAISVAPFATQATRQAYLDALHLANFTSVLGLVDEGTAVALNFVSSRRADSLDQLAGVREYHMIYDMGAGLTTATLFSYVPFSNGSTELELESVGYDESFGGQMLTHSLYIIFKEKFYQAFGLKASQEVGAKVEARLLEAAEKAKIVLSVNSDYFVSLESLYLEKDFRTTVSRQEFEDYNSDLLSRITTPILTAIKGSPNVAGVQNVKSVVLTGGSTRVPFVKKHLTTLLSEDQISKNVNADESCAIGTTARAFKLKTHLEKAKDIRVIDKVYHNYEFMVGSSNANPTAVFAQGTPISAEAKINLSNATKGASDSLDIGLYEDGRLIKLYSLDGLDKKAEKLKCKGAKDAKQVFGTFVIDHNKMFGLAKVEIECVAEESKKKGFILNLLKKNEDEEEETVDEEDVLNASNATNSSKKATVVKRTALQPRPLNVPLPKPSFTHVRPMSSTSKERTLKKLAVWNSLDDKRFEADTVKNILEGQCYEFRSFIEDNEELLEREITGLSSYTDFVAEVIEWLEFESDGSSVEQFRAKISEINDKKKELNRIIEMTKADLSLDGLKNLYEEGSKIVMSIQGYLIEFGTEINELRTKFEEQGFDFDKENDRVKLQLLGKAGGIDKMMSLDRALAEYKDELTHLGDIVDMDVTKFNRLGKTEVYGIYETISNKIMEMLSDVMLVEEAHKDRITLFQNKLKKLQDRKAQKELREKLKVAAKQQKEEEEAEEQDEKVDVTQAAVGDESGPTEKAGGDESVPTEALPHDEL